MLMQVTTVALSEDTRTVAPRGRENLRRALVTALNTRRLMWSYCSGGFHFPWSMSSFRCAPHPIGHVSVKRQWEKLVESPMEGSWSSHHLAACHVSSSTGILVLGGSWNWFQNQARFHCRGRMWR